MIRLAYFCCFIVLFSSCNVLQRTTTSPTKKTPTFDWQGHRGARGLLPENTIPAFLKALEYPVTTLELDVVITKDKQIILSHEPWLSAEICNKADGTAISKEESPKLNMYEMTYAEIQAYDCGSRGNVRFPEQKGMPTTKQTLAEVVQAVEKYVKQNKLQRPSYNIEIKSKPKWDAIYTPLPADFAALVLAEVERLGIAKRMTIQSFDVRALQATRTQKPNMPLVLLIENQDGIAANLETLGFLPDVYSPMHLLLTKEKVSLLHEKGMKVIPWTVNEVKRMQELIEMGVDGIITDYPDKIERVKRMEN